MRTIRAALPLLLLLTIFQPVQAVADMTQEAIVSEAERSQYRNIAQRIFAKIAALRDRYPTLEAFGNAVPSEDANDRFWIAYQYQADMTWADNRHYRPGLKNSRTIKSFGKNGFEINLYFYTGDWFGQRVVRPITVGRLHIVFLIEGEESARLADLGRDINTILAEEKDAFEKAVHDSAH